MAFLPIWVIPYSFLHARIRTHGFVRTGSYAWMRAENGDAGTGVDSFARRTVAERSAECDGPQDPVSTSPAMCSRITGLLDVFD